MTRSSKQLSQAEMGKKMKPVAMLAIKSTGETSSESTAVLPVADTYIVDLDISKADTRGDISAHFTPGDIWGPLAHHSFQDTAGRLSLLHENPLW